MPAMVSATPKADLPDELQMQPHLSAAWLAELAAPAEQLAVFASNIVTNFVGRHC